MFSDEVTNYLIALHAPPNILPSLAQLLATRYPKFDVNCRYEAGQGVINGKLDISIQRPEYAKLENESQSTVHELAHLAEMELPRALMSNFNLPRDESTTFKGFSVVRREIRVSCYQRHFVKTLEGAESDPTLTVYFDDQHDYVRDFIDPTRKGIPWSGTIHLVKEYGEEFMRGYIQAYIEMMMFQCTAEKMYEALDERHAAIN